MKQCKTCQEVKPLSMYSKKPDTKDGLQPICKTCAAEFRKAWVESRTGYVRAYNKAYHAANRDGIAKQKREKRLADPEITKQKDRATYARNAEAQRVARKRYYEANRDACLATVKRWRQEKGKVWRDANAAILGERVVRRNSTKRKATPSWSNQKAIQDFYITADGLRMLTGEWYHVDHIVPLINPLVCGLHTEANLQILTAFDNVSKSNRHWPDQP